jgi:hypothetical protein
MPMPNAECLMPNRDNVHAVAMMRHSAFGIWHLAFGIWHSAFGIRN